MVGSGILRQSGQEIAASECFFGEGVAGLAALDLRLSPTSTAEQSTGVSFRASRLTLSPAFAQASGLLRIFRT